MNKKNQRQHTAWIVHSSHLLRLERFQRSMRGVPFRLDAERLANIQKTAFSFKKSPGSSFVRVGDADMAYLVEYILDLVGWMFENKAALAKAIDPALKTAGANKQPMNVDNLIDAYCRTASNLLSSVREEFRAEVFCRVPLLGTLLAMDNFSDNQEVTQ